MAGFSSLSGIDLTISQCRETLVLLLYTTMSEGLLMRKETDSPAYRLDVRIILSRTRTRQAG
jgi:hypothetical protein